MVDSKGSCGLCVNNDKFQHTSFSHSEYSQFEVKVIPVNYTLGGTFVGLIIIFISYDNSVVTKGTHTLGLPS